jgi:hypothetical protein
MSPDRAADAAPPTAQQGQIGRHLIAFYNHWRSLKLSLSDDCQGRLSREHF